MNGRHIPKSAAGALEFLELEQPVVVTRDTLAGALRNAGRRNSAADVAYLARILRENGWLRSLRTTGAWEFAPGARAGAHGSGDPFIELRAWLTTHDEAEFQVASHSAAWLHGWANHQSDPPDISAYPGTLIPRALRGFSVVRWHSAQPALDLSELPVWGADTLIAFMASRPTRFGGWTNASSWLPDAAKQATYDGLRNELADEPHSSWARAAYLLTWSGQPHIADVITQDAPPGVGPFHLGSRATGQSIYNKQHDVVDHVLATAET